MEKDIHANSYQKKAGVAILISDKADFRAYKITRDKKRDFIKMFQFTKKV